MMTLADLFTIRWEKTEQIVAPSDENPESDDCGMLVYTSMHAAKCAAWQQTVIYGDVRRGSASVVSLAELFGELDDAKAMTEKLASIDEIRRRFETQIAANDESSWFQAAHADRVALLAEVDRLTKEVHDAHDDSFGYSRRYRPGDKEMT